MKTYDFIVQICNKNKHKYYEITRNQGYRQYL